MGGTRWPRAATLKHLHTHPPEQQQQFLCLHPQDDDEGKGEAPTAPPRHTVIFLSSEKQHIVFQPPVAKCHWDHRGRSAPSPSPFGTVSTDNMARSSFYHPLFLFSPHQHGHTHTSTHNTVVVTCLLKTFLVSSSLGTEGEGKGQGSVGAEMGARGESKEEGSAFGGALWGMFQVSHRIQTGTQQSDKNGEGGNCCGWWKKAKRKSHANRTTTRQMTNWIREVVWLKETKLAERKENTMKTDLSVGKQI